MIIPGQLLEELQAVRLIYGLAGIMKKDIDYRQKVGDAEALAYLMTASLRAPVSHEFVEIQTYLTAKVMSKSQKNLKDMPNFLCAGKIS